MGREGLGLSPTYIIPAQLLLIRKLCFLMPVFFCLLMFFRITYISETVLQILSKFATFTPIGW